MPIDYTKKPRPSGGAPVTLTKASPTVSLTKRAGQGGTLRVNLKWNPRPDGVPAAQPAPRGLLKRLQQAAAPSSAIDLDLGCMYEYADGTKGVVQALGNTLRDAAPGDPICWLDRDDRSGASAEGENLFVDLAKVGSISRILVFAFIYDGVTNWAGADAVVTLHPASGPQVEVRLDEHDPTSSMCGIAMLENVGGELTVRREVRYVRGHRDLDEAYGWGMRWTAGRK
jgi:tellurite resistance protein TerA